MQIKDWPDIPFWEELARTSPECTFYHTPLWHDIVIKAYKDYSIGTRGFIFDNGGRAVFPFIQTKKGRPLLGKSRLKSSVFGGYGGIIADTSAGAAQQQEIYAFLVKQRASISIDTNPFSKTAVKLPDGFICKEDFTQALALTRDEQALYQKLNRGGKSNLNQAKKHGITVRLAKTEQDIHTYYALYKDTLRRWGDGALFEYPESLFFTIFAHAGDGIKIWLAEKEAVIVAGVIIFYWNRIATYWHGASHQDYFQCYPNNMLHMEIIRDAAAAGFHYYDFGPSGGQEGVARFKKSFGAVELPFVSAHRKFR